MDYMIRATADAGNIRAFAVTARDTVETARQAHNTSPVISAALGRLLCAGLMMGRDMKSEDDLLTVQIGCEGPVKGLTVTARNDGTVKGYANEPSVMLPPSQAGKLDVGGALGQGVLSVIRDTGLKEPYVGQTILISGEIAEDLAYYYAVSEQIPTSVALGVLMNHDNTVKRAGGFIVQLMPGCPDETAEKLENNIRAMKSVTAMLDAGSSPEDILKLALDGFEIEINDSVPVSFVCDCSRERVEKVLIGVGEAELENMIAEGKPAELVCHFCNKKYVFSVEDMQELLEKAR